MASLEQPVWKLHLDNYNPRGKRWPVLSSPYGNFTLMIITRADGVGHTVLSSGYENIWKLHPYNYHPRGWQGLRNELTFYPQRSYFGISGTSVITTWSIQLSFNDGALNAGYRGRSAGWERGGGGISLPHPTTSWSDYKRNSNCKCAPETVAKKIQKYTLHLKRERLTDWLTELLLHKDRG